MAPAMKIAIRKMGNSHGVIIPKPLLSQAGLDNEAEMTLEKGCIVLRRPPSAPRDGWAEGSREVATEGATATDWFSFANEQDADLQW